MSSLEAERASRIAEISGWDTEENFFVEKTVLHHHCEGNKAGLHARLRVGSLVFIRVPEDTSMDRTVPVTYQVSGITGTTIWKTFSGTDAARADSFAAARLAGQRARTGERDFERGDYSGE
jgi:hypothetical protein